MFARVGYRILSALLLLLFGIAIGGLYEPVGGFLRERAAEIRAFASGHPLEHETTAWQKIQNDLGIAPWRTLREAEIPAEFGYRPVRPADAVAGLLAESELELYLDRQSPLAADYAGLLVKTPVSTERGFSYRLLLVGFDGVVHKALALGDTQTCRCDARGPLDYYHIGGDPAAAATTGNRLIKVNACGGSDWSIDSRYSFHHYLNNDGDHGENNFWVLDATDLVQIDAHDGAALQRLSLSEIINANPDLHIFEARLAADRPGRWVYGDTAFVPLGRTHAQVAHADPDPFHGNDVDEYRGGGEGLFRRGDLVLSLRSLNLVLVVRPATRKIVWYAYGMTSRQHDPDFVSADSVMVYDNNFHNPRSRIVELRASAGSGGQRRFGTQRIERLESFDGYAFHQLTEGYQFLSEDGRTLVFSAGYYDVGVDLESRSAVLALRHRWRDQAYLNLEIERLLSAADLAAIVAARCR